MHSGDDRRYGLGDGRDDYASSSSDRGSDARRALAGHPDGLNDSASDDLVRLLLALQVHAVGC